MAGSNKPEWSWEQKAEALQVLAQLVVRMRGPGDWYARCERTDLIRGSMRHGVYGNGATPVEAIEHYFELLTTLERDGEKFDCIVVGELPPYRRHYVWSGFMWKELPVEAAQEK